MIPHLDHGAQPAARSAEAHDPAREAVLVTGGAGFIGAAVCAALLARGERVVLADRLPGARQQVAATRLAAGHPAALELHEEDLQRTDLRRLLRGVDRVVHLAGTPGVQTSWAEGFGAHLDGNLLLTQRLLEAALDAPLRRVVLASSSSVYGDVPRGATAEDAPVAPVSPYGVTKAGVELLARTYAGRGVATTSLRYFTAYGRGQRPDMAVARMLDAVDGGPPFPLRGDGQQVRDLTHVDDVVAGTLAALDAPLAPGTVLNIGSGRPVALRDLLVAVGRAVGRPVPVVPVSAAAGDPSRTHADVSRAAELLGWTPSVALGDGLADQVEHGGRHTAVTCPAVVRPTT